MKHLVAILVTACFFSIGAQSAFAISCDYDSVFSSIYSENVFSETYFDNTDSDHFDVQEYWLLPIFFANAILHSSYHSVHNDDTTTFGFKIDFVSGTRVNNKGAHDNPYLFSYRPFNQFSEPVFQGYPEVFCPESSISTADDNMAPVPEPATIFLLGSGLVGLIGVSKKKLKR